MVKTLKILSWIYVGITIFTLVAFVSFARTGRENLSPQLQGTYDNMCAAGYCTPGAPITNSDIGQVLVSMILPVLIILGILLFALYKRTRPAYYISMVLFLVIFVTQLGRGNVSFPSLVFFALLSTKSVREYFKKDKGAVE